MIADETRELLEHAIAKTLVVAGTLVADGKGSRIATIGSDQQLLQRAARVILKGVLRELVSRDQLSRKEFRRLLDEVASLANES